jgi:hypothetical protein
MGGFINETGIFPAVSHYVDKALININPAILR